MALFGLTPSKPDPKTAPAASTDGGAGGDIIDVTDASFMKEVIEESQTRPVVIDFWAPWCGPCRQLTPSIEKAVTAKKGAVRLAKINIDENPAIAQQFRVQSIPAVFVVDQGKAFQGFQGALPESQVKAFIDELAGPQGPSDIDGVLALAAESLALGDMGGAAQAYAQALQMEPENLKAIAGLARCYLNGGDVERAKEVVSMAPTEAKDADLAGVRAALALAEQAQGETAPLERRLAADAADHEARFELAGVLAGRGDYQGAADHLLTIVAQDRAWNEEAARKQLVTVFEAAGLGSEVARNGRRRLSSLLFS
jgi:putative thioredoxin